MGVVGDVGLARDDGDALEAGEWDGQGNAHVCSHPEESLGSGESSDID